jgi:hypothetical protein
VEPVFFVSNMDLSRLDQRGLVVALDVFRHVIAAALLAGAGGIASERRFGLLQSSAR